MRTFETGAVRDSEQEKLDFEGALSPIVLERYVEYMQKHCIQADGSVRSCDNWQKGMPLDCYMKSAWRHFRDWWLEHRGYQSHTQYETHSGLEDALCAVIFNSMGYLHELLKARNYKMKDINS